VIETPMLTVEDSARRGAFVKRLFQAFVEGGNQVYYLPWQPVLTIYDMRDGWPP